MLRPANAADERSLSLSLASLSSKLHVTSKVGKREIWSLVRSSGCGGAKV